MRIVHYNVRLWLEDGGPVRATLDLARLFAERSHRVTVLTTDPKDAPAAWGKPGNNPLVVSVGKPVLSGGFFAPAQLRAMKQYLAEADVIHLHGVWTPSNLQVAAIASGLGIPYCVSCRGMLDDWPMSQRTLKKRVFLAMGGSRFLNRASFVHCTAAGELAQSQKWFPRARGIVIPNLLDLEPFRDLPGVEPARTAYPQAFGAGFPTVLFLSRVHYKKGAEHFIRAAAMLRDRGSAARFAIAGDGDPAYMASLRKLAADLKLEGTVHFLGMVRGTTKISVYQASSVFALPTSQENFGFALIESMAAGTPVITTKGVDLWPELEATGAALIVKQDATDFARAIASVIGDEPERELMSHRARRWVFHELTERRIIDMFTSAYESVVRPAARHHAPTRGEGPMTPDEASALIGGATSETPVSDGGRNIVHFLQRVRLEHGGVVRAVLDLSAQLASTGDRVTLVTCDGADIPPAWFQLNSATPSILTLAGMVANGALLAPSSLNKLRPVLERADVVHLHGMWTSANLQVASMAKELGKAYVLSPHGMLDDWPMSQRTLKKKIYLRLFGRRLLNDASAVHCTAEAELQQSSKWFNSGRGVSVPLVFDTRPFEKLPGPGLAREHYPQINTGKPSILFLSRINYKKGPDVLLHAAARLAAEKVDFTLLFAGTGEAEYTAQMKELCNSLGLAPHVHFLGMVTGDLKLSVYQAADVFALPTSQENFGFVFFEALACGTPVVTTKGVDVWPELESSGGAKIVDRTAEAFAEAIRGRLGNPDTTEEMGRSGREWVMRELAPTRVIGRFRAMYDGAIEHARRRGAVAARV